MRAYTYLAVGFLEDPNVAVWIAALLMLLLLISPMFAYLCFGWCERKAEIISGLKADAIDLYFQQFYPSLVRPKDQTREAAFDQYYTRQFGRRHFIIPVLLLIAVAATAVFWSTFSVIDWLGSQPTAKGHLPELAVAALLGAYMYSTSDLISRWRSSDLSPTDLWWQSFRFAIATPTAYAISSAFNESIAPAVAFLLGAFPTTTILKVARRIAAKHVDLGDTPENPTNDLHKLQGINVTNAERLGDEGISTILQLAYADPVKLAIRTNIAFAVVVDYMSQALLWIYLTDDLPKVAKIGLRGAYEMRVSWLDLKEPKKPEDETSAQAVLEKSAARLGMHVDEMHNIWQMVALDPYAYFLCEVW